MKIVFAGSPAYALPALKALYERGEVAGVITQPDKPVGRKRVLTPTPVKQFALEKGIPVLDFSKIREHVEDVKALGGDIMITCAYGQILSKEILLSFPEGVWNLHASLLPKFRGASPIQSAILAGERHTGVTVMKTEVELDSGDILLVKRCEVGEKTYGELSEELSLLSAEAALEAIEYIEAGNPQVLMQDESAATYCKKITAADAKLDFTEASACVRLIKAMSPSPLAWCSKEGVRLNIHDARLCPGMDGGEGGRVVKADKKGIVVSCAEGCFEILKAQFAGGKPLSASDLVNGRKIKEGDRLD